MDRRIKLVFILFSAWFIIVAGKLWYMQVLRKARFIEMSAANRIRLVRLQSPRGMIYDRNGVLLADNKPATQLVVMVDEVADPQSIAGDLSNLTKLSTEYILKKIKENMFKPFLPAVLASDMNDETLVRVSESRWRLPGIAVQVAPVRDYLSGEVYSHLIGYVGEVGKEELDSGYSWGDIVGRTGIEKVWDRELRGTIGYKEVQVDYKGDVDRILNIVEPKIGVSLRLTIDSVLQEELYKAMKGKRGAGVVINHGTGEILALVGTPGFDTNLLVSPVKEEVITRLFTDRTRPMVNRAAAGLYPPGSVFKIIVALAGLEKGVITKKTIFYCDGEFQLGNTRFKCWEKKGHGWMDLSSALKKSCNEYFYQAGLKAGVSAIVNMAERFGLGKYTGIGIPGEKDGLLPGEGSPRPFYPEEQLRSQKGRGEPKWYTGDTVNLSIGHGRILVTPIQTACLISAIANGGVLYKPRLIMGENPEGTKIDIDSEYIDLIKKGLFRVVNEPDGTGHKAYISGQEIAGKTGTVELTEKGRVRNICWFAGYSPQIAVVIVTEEGESGGATAGPIAQRVFKKYDFSQRAETH